MHRLIFMFLLPALARAQWYYTMNVFADVMADKEFFKSTYPLIIEKLSGNIEPTYHLLGSGKYAVPQMCVLDQLRLNTFLQAEYLRCEAEELPSETCLCRSGIDSKAYKQCVLQGGSKAILAAEEYQKLNVNVSPVIGMWSGLDFKVFQDDYLKNICSVYLDNHKPPGCLNLSGNDTMSHSDRTIPVHFQC